ncbi:MAG: tRNA preQ1(34) S-adenosylmethionine ribosyltransferase-isomerase QueA [Chloroflexota bacterium]
MKVSDFDYHLPSDFIAQTPIDPRDRSRLMVLRRSDQAIEHSHFYHIGNYLKPGDLLVFNDSRVFRARLFGRTGNGNQVEVLLLRRLEENVWQATTRPGKKTRPGAKLTFESPGGDVADTAEVIKEGEGGTRIIRFSSEEPLERLGKAPLPPYIKAPLADPERYQTVYARVKGSAAAPTAGLHFTPELLRSLQERGIQFTFVTLHIGLDTFRPVRVEDPIHHHIHKEWGEVTMETAEAINHARKEGRRIIAVGTTSTRILEASALPDGAVRSLSSWIDLFILPGHRFRAVDAMLTNFHLPRSTLLMLVSAFAGREFILRAYTEAQSRGYRFYSFGDACLIL